MILRPILKRAAPSFQSMDIIAPDKYDILYKYNSTLVQPSGTYLQLISANTVRGDVQLTVAVMEDYERILHFYSRGLSCMRCDFLSVKSENKGRGGCASAFIDYSVEAQKEKNEKAPGS